MKNERKKKKVANTCQDNSSSVQVVCVDVGISRTSCLWFPLFCPLFEGASAVRRAWLTSSRGFSAFGIPLPRS